MIKELWKPNNKFFLFVRTKVRLTAEKIYKEFIINTALKQASLDLLLRATPIIKSIMFLLAIYFHQEVQGIWKLLELTK